MTSGGAARSVPSCSRCRRRKIKCDRRLPTCNHCASSGSECTGFDSINDREVPRSIVQHLEQEIAALEKELELRHDPIPSSSYKSPLLQPSHEKSNTRTQEVEILQQLGEAVNFDNHFFLRTDDAVISRFHGSSSIFSLTVEVLASATVKTFYQSSPPTVALISSPHDTQARFGTINPARLSEMSEATIQSLISLFLSSTNVIYPIMDRAEVEADLQTYLALQSLPNLDITRLNEAESYQFFRVSMICGIACANRSRREPSFLPFSHGFFEQAAMCVEEVTSAVSSHSLQALLLLVCYCLFYPRKGNIWKLLDFACRLSIELGYHTEQDFQLEDEKQRAMRRRIFWTLYTIEHTMGQVFGRPSDLPDAIISTAFPEVTLENTLNQKTSDVASSYRLMQLRSEIYDSIYLTTYLPLYDAGWVEERYSQLSQWFGDSEDSILDTLTDIHRQLTFHSSLLFLFQPGILCILSQANSAPATLPVDSYYSACKLIEIYRKILQATDSFPELAAYPITILSVFSIWQAAMILMAHCLLSIDGQVGFYSLKGGRSTQYDLVTIDYSNIFEMSSSCLILLAWCAERWAGIEGTMDAYRRLSQRLLPELVQRGYFTSGPNYA